VILGLGIDVASVPRMQAALERHGERLWERVLTPDERKSLGRRRDQATALAGRWAAKEAAIKAFSGKAGAAWHHFEIHRGPGGAPEMRFYGKAAVVAAHLGVQRAHVSITHDAGVAAAVVVLEGA
jgi:holo-[acyl-carrier protein] synthase